MIYIPLYIILFIFAFRLFRFVTTPFFKKIGFYKYYSDMLFLMPFSPKIYEFHLGTSWDFLKAKKLSAKSMFLILTEGLVNICNDLESGKLKRNIKLKGNTYYINPESVTKYGFKYRNMNIFETIMFYLNYVELCILYSVYQNKISFIPFKNVKIIFISADDLLNNKQNYLKIYYKLKFGNYNKTA